MRRFTEWLRRKYLPEYVKQGLVEENERLRRRVAELEEKLEKQQAYINGMHDAMRHQRRITINTTGEGGK